MNIVMGIHIAGGLLALPAGTIAVAARKGGRLHARAGTWFFASMLVLGVTAAILEPFRTPPGLAGRRDHGLLFRRDLLGRRAPPRRDDRQVRDRRLRGRARSGRAHGLGRVSPARDDAGGPRPGLRARRRSACSPACSISTRSCARSSRPPSGSRVTSGGCASPSSSPPAPSSSASRTCCPRRCAARRSSSSWPSRRSR